MRHILFLAIIICFQACKTDKPDDASKDLKTVATPSDAPIPIKTYVLAKADFHIDMVANGTVAAQRVADLRFQQSEVLAAVYVKNGDRVLKGQKIAELDRFKLKSALMQARDNFEKAKLDLQDVLIGQGYNLRDSLRIPAETMAIARVKSNYDHSSTSLQMAEYHYNNAVLVAPFAGIVANLFQKQYNMASASEVFCRIIDNAQPEVEFRVLENELALIAKGDKVQVSPYAFAETLVEGRISEINPVIESNGMVRVKAVLPSNAKLVEGMNVKVLVQRRVAQQLVVPKEALVLRTNKKVMFTVRDGKAMWNYVSTGLENSTSYVITEGLKEGDVLVVDGSVHLAHESPVVIIK